MKGTQHITDLFKESLNGGSDFNNSLWEKLDDQLQPVRDAYNKRQRRRVFAYWSFAAIMLVGGGAAYYNTNGNSQKIAAVQKTATAVEQKSCCAKPTVADRFGVNPMENNATTQTENVETNTYNSGNSAVGIILETNTVNQPTTIKHDKTIAKKNIHASNKNTSVKTVAPLISDNRADKDIAVANQDVQTTKSTDGALDTKSNVADNNSQVVAPIVDNTQGVNLVNPDPAKTKVATVTIPKNIPNAVIKNAVALKKKATFGVQMLGGINAASSFNKTGVVVGAQLNITADDKKIFIGAKVAKNDIKHQLLSIDKAGTNPTAADAMINKMTVIQIPFGYQFALNKKLHNATLLNVGFEPTLLTGIETIYYDNGGVAGAPTTPVYNSPLIDKAVNRFNVSFILGLQKQLNSRVGLFGNVGYGLINITDKQFYNKTGAVNNLRYFQAGVSFKLNK